VRILFPLLRFKVGEYEVKTEQPWRTENMNGAPKAFRKGRSARHAADLFKAGFGADLGRCTALVGWIVELLWKVISSKRSNWKGSPRAPNALAAALAVLVVGQLSVCLEKQESERRERWQRRDFYFPPWHNADIIFVLVRNYEWIRFLLTIRFSFLCVNFEYRRDVTSEPSKMGLQASQQACPLHFSSRRQRLAYKGFSKKPPHVCC